MKLLDRAFIKEKFRFQYPVALFISLITLVVYLPALQNDFVNWDDNIYITDNIRLRSLDWPFVKWAFLEFYASNWHPLTLLSHCLDYYIWGLNPAGHHLTSVILHSINTFLVVLLCFMLIEIIEVRRNLIGHENNYPAFIRVKNIPAVITGILFGLHPLHVESVAWVSERKDVLSALFFILSVITYIKYVEKKEKNTEYYSNVNKYYIICMLFFILSLLSKPMAVTLPAVLLIIDWYPLDRFRNKISLRLTLIEKIPFILLSIGSGVVTILAMRSGQSLSSFVDLSLWTRIIVALSSYADYTAKILWPHMLLPFYPYVKITHILTFTTLIKIVIVAAAILIFVVLSKRFKALTSLMSYYVITLLPVIGLIQTGSQAMADRYTYLPSLGPFIGIGLFVGWVVESSKKHILSKISFLTVYGFISLLMVVLAFLTNNQIRVWRDSLTLWNYVINNLRSRETIYINMDSAYNNRGLAYAKKDELARALEDYTRAIELNPVSPEPYNNRGILYDRMGRFDDALADFSKALLLTYYRKEIIYNNRAIVYRKMGLFHDALNDYTHAIELNSELPDLYYNRANTYTLLGRYAEAVEDYTSAINLSPLSQEDYYRNRGIVYNKMGRLEESKRDIEQAAKMKRNIDSVDKQ